MIDGLFDKERLLDVIHNFIYFPDDSCDKELKIVCNYPQYFASNKLLKNVLLLQELELLLRKQGRLQDVKVT